MHLTTGTHVAQIRWFLLTESRHVPARLAQTAPPRDDTDGAGKRDIIDLDLSRDNALQQRVDLASRDDSNLLKGGIRALGQWAGLSSAHAPAPSPTSLCMLWRSAVRRGLSVG